jgi:tetratricopeptide (TPR) repeat protein
MTATVVPFRPSPEPAFVPERVPVPEPEVNVVDTVDTTGDFETLRDRARDLGNSGSYREAAVLYRRAAEVATAAEDSDGADEALCGWCTAETELGNGAKVMPELRRILLGSSVDYNCWLASYTLARAHELEGQIKKALFYARLSLQHSGYVDRPGSIAGSRNLLGNLLITEGREAEAAAEYRRALKESHDAPPAWTATVEVNLGYCVLTDAFADNRVHRRRLREGLRLTYRSLRTLRREEAGPLLVWPHLDLCFAYLEMERPKPAMRHGCRALELAGRYENRDVVKNCLYLLGQTAMLQRDTEAARQFFGQLEQRFYPDRAGLKDVLMSLDLRQVVNLRA